VNIILLFQLRDYGWSKCGGFVSGCLTYYNYKCLVIYSKVTY